MAVPSYVTGAVAHNQNTAFSIGVPGSGAGVAAGMVALLWLEVATAATGTNPAGWTQLGSDVVISAGTFGRLLYKVLGAGDIGANVTMTLSITSKWSASLAVYQDVDQTTPIHAWNILLETVSQAAHSTPVPTVSLAGCLGVYGILERGTVSTGVSVGTGMTSRQADLGPLGAGSGLTAIADSNGSIPTGNMVSRVFTLTTTTANVATFAVALKPAASTTAAADTKIPGQLVKVALDTIIALGTVRAYLLDATYVFDEDNHTFLSDVVSHEVATGNGYTAGGKATTGGATSYDSTGNAAKYTSDPVAWTQSPGQTLKAGFCAIVVKTGSNATSPILCIVNAGGEVQASGALTVTPDTVDGWLAGAQILV